MAKRVHRGFAKRRQPGSLKAAFARLVRACGGTDAAGRVVGKSASQIRRATDPAEAAQLTVQDVLRLEVFARDMIVTGWLAHAQGAALLKLPAHWNSWPIHRGIGRVARTIGALLEAYGQGCNSAGDDAAVDGALVEKIDEALSALSDLRARLAPKEGP